LECKICGICTLCLLVLRIHLPQLFVLSYPTRITQKPLASTIECLAVVDRIFLRGRRSLDTRHYGCGKEKLKRGVCHRQWSGGRHAFNLGSVQRKKLKNTSLFFLYGEHS
jgi:hypothetical protein